MDTNVDRLYRCSESFEYEKKELCWKVDERGGIFGGRNHLP